MNEYISNPDEAREYADRYRLFHIVIAIVVALFTVRLWYLQIMSGSELREFSEKNRIKQNKILSPRGQMLDREGRILVDNLPGFEAILQPQYVEDLNKLAEAVAPIIGMTPDKFIQKVQRSRRRDGPYAQIRLKENLTRDEVFRLKRIRLNFPGLEIRESIVRYYPMRENGAHLFGYVAEISKRELALRNEMHKGHLTFEQGDIIGKAGLEETLERSLRGEDGLRFIQVDAHGREVTKMAVTVYGESLKETDPVPGNTAVLTIDRDIQNAAHQSMEKHNRLGAVVAMKSNGEILAWHSRPGFDPNEFALGIEPEKWTALINDPFKPLRNKVIQDHIPPGSTWKVFVALAALQEKVIKPDTIISAPGVFWFGRRPYHDHLKGGHGNINVYDAIERSSNVFFYKMGIALTVDKMFNYIAPFGFGQKTGIELSRETPGLLPSADWKLRTRKEEWQPGENLSMAIGQGFTVVTPLQMAVAYNAIGTNGKVVRPFVVRKIVSPEGQVLKENFPTEIRDLTKKQTTGIHIDRETFEVVKEAMRRVANGERGTARWWKVPGVQMAGKTGTVQTMSFSADQIYTKCETRPLHLRHHGWYVAWAPWDKPEITVAVKTLHSCHGSSGSAPIVRDVMEAYFRKYHPEVVQSALAKGHKAPVVPATVEDE